MELNSFGHALIDMSRATSWGATQAVPAMLIPMLGARTVLAQDTLLNQIQSFVGSTHPEECPRLKKVTGPRSYCGFLPVLSSADRLLEILFAVAVV